MTVTAGWEEQSISSYQNISINYRCRLSTSDHIYHLFLLNVYYKWASHRVKWYRICLPAHEMLIRSLGQEDPLEKEMTIYSSVLAWRIPWTKEPGWLWSRGLQRAGPNWATEHICMHILYTCIAHWPVVMFTTSFLLNIFTFVFLVTYI